MLKILKQAWKKDDSKHSQIGLGGDRGGQSTQSSGASSGTPHLDAVVAAPPSSDSAPLVPALSHTLKRTISSVGPGSFANDEVDRSEKKSKVEHADSAHHHHLKSRLPEVLDVSSPSIVEEILHQAKSENTIVVLPSGQTHQLISQYLTWAVQLSESEPTANNHRIALVLVENNFGIDENLSEIRAKTSLRADKYVNFEDKHDNHKWPDLLRKDVVVTTTVSFHRALRRGEIAMMHLHTLVVLDILGVEKQGVGLPGSMKEVMEDFYRAAECDSRPKLLALATQSATFRNYSKLDILHLESVFDAKHFNVISGRLSENPSVSCLPSEFVVLYDCPVRSADTKLFKQLHQLDPTESSFGRYFRAARKVFTEVGACASDLVWRRALKEIEACVTPSYEEEGEEASGQSGEASAKARSTLREIVKNWVYAMPNLDTSSRGYNVTPKFARLVQILRSCQPSGESFRGIIFVQSRVMALAITDLLRNLGDYIDHIRPCAMTGLGSHADSAQQEEICRAFAAGTYNLLIATKSVEDLDIPKATIIIRFDLFESQLSHAYARLRVRGRGSHVVHMIERGNDTHRRILSQLTLTDDKTRIWSDTFCRSQGNSIAPSTLHESTNSYRSDSEDNDEEFIQDPTTSGRIYPQDATYVIHRFAATLDNLQNGGLGLLLFEYDEERLENGATRTTCRLNLSGSPIHAITGSHRISKSLARRAACYQACLELRKRGFLDYRLFPLPFKTSVIRDEERASTSVGRTNDINPSSSLTDLENKAIISRCYPIKKPDFWINVLSAPVTSLYPTVIMTGINSELSQPYAPMLILTRLPLPEFNPFKLFFSGVPATIRFRPHAEVKLNEEQLHDIYLYTIRVCRAVANKPFTCSFEKMAYFFAPLHHSWKEPPQDRWYLPDIVGHIPWKSVSVAAQSWVTKLQASSIDLLAKDMEDAVIQDRMVEFTRRYDALRLRTDLTPLSRPVDSPRDAGYANLVDYCKARRKGFEGLQDYGQPIIEVSKVPAVVNQLNPTSRPVDSFSKVAAKYLIPELCVKFTIPASTLRTALLLPSVTRRIDDFLLVKELNAKLFDHAISERLLHVALSAPSGGIEYDYERLELLGDSFLKYLSSIYVFVTNPAQNEGALHIARQRIISNKTLLHSAVLTGMPSYVQAKPFAIRMWQPPNFSVSTTTVHGDEDSTTGAWNVDGMVAVETQQSALEGSAGLEGADERSMKKRRKRWHNDQNTHWLGNKAVADVAEAIIGAAYLSGGRENALKITKALNVPIHNIDHWSDFGRKALAPPPDASAQLNTGSIEAVEAIIGHKFHRPHLLAQALTHSSTQGYESTSYERLEFIGDAILDFLVIRYIFDRYKHLSPGGLTLLKGAMVSNSTLAAVCVWSGLWEHLLFDSHHLANSIDTYADQLKTKQTEECRLAERGNRLPGQYWVDIEPPKALSDVIESIAGAIYISDNFAPVGVEALFDNVLKPFYDRHVTLKTLSHHPTRILFELFQAQGCQQFQITKEKHQELTHCQVIVHDVVLASATDTTAPFASRLVSSFALDALEGDPEFLSRTCDCRAHAGTRRGPNKSFVLSELED